MKKRRDSSGGEGLMAGCRPKSLLNLYHFRERAWGEPKVVGHPCGQPLSTGQNRLQELYHTPVCVEPKSVALCSGSDQKGVSTGLASIRGISAPRDGSDRTRFPLPRVSRMMLSSKWEISNSS